MTQRHKAVSVRQTESTALDHSSTTAGFHCSFQRLERALPDTIRQACVSHLTALVSLDCRQSSTGTMQGNNTAVSLKESAKFLSTTVTFSG